MKKMEGIFTLLPPTLQESLHASLPLPSLYLLNYFKQFLIFFLLHVLFFFVFHCLLYVTFFILIASSPAMFVIYFIFCCLNDETSFRCFKIHSKNQFSNFFLIRVKLFTGHFFYNTSIIIFFFIFTNHLNNFILHFSQAIRVCCENTLFLTHSVSLEIKFAKIQLTI